jgi:hypothetical protein
VVYRQVAGTACRRRRLAVGVCDCSTALQCSTTDTVCHITMARVSSGFPVQCVIACGGTSWGQAKKGGFEAAHCKLTCSET